MLNLIIMSNWTAEKILELRQRFGDTRKEFGERIRASAAAIKYWEEGRGKPNGPTTKLFDYMERDLDFFNGMAARHPENLAAAK